MYAQNSRQPGSRISAASICSTNFSSSSACDPICIVTWRSLERNNRYTLSELLLALMYPMILGLEKIEVSALLKTNGIFQYLTGLPSFPNPVTLRRFLIRAAPSLLPQLRRVHDELRTQCIRYPHAQSSFWLDCDSTTHTLYGHQEGVVKGYNPAHRGKRGYHPLVVTEAHLGDCLSRHASSG